MSRPETGGPRFSFVLPTRPEREWLGYGPAEHRAQTVQAAEIAGFDGVVAPYDLDGEESTAIANDALRHSRWLETIHELHIASANPVYAAKEAASTQRFSGQRLSWWLAVDAPTYSQSTPAATTAAEWYQRAEEFLTVAKGVWQHDTFEFSGRYHSVTGGGFRAALAGLTFPRLYLGGTGEEALAFSARHADVHVFTSADDVRRLGPGLRERAGRDLELALATRVTVREEAGELAGVPSGDPGLYGTYDEVTRQVEDLVAAGVGRFIVSAEPRVEEAYRIGEYLLARVRSGSTSAADLVATGGQH